MAPKLSIHLGGSTRATSGLTPENLQFAAQLGVTHIVTSDEAGEMIPKTDGFWAVDDLVAVRKRVEAGGLTLAAIENFPADHWDRILLGAEGRAQPWAVETFLKKVPTSSRRHTALRCLNYTSNSRVYL